MISLGSRLRASLTASSIAALTVLSSWRGPKPDGSGDLGRCRAHRGARRLRQRARPRRPRIGDGGKTRRRGFSQHRARQTGRDHFGGPSEQARHRRRYRAAMVRHRTCRCGHRPCGELGRPRGGGASHAEQSNRSGFGCCDLGAHRRECSPVVTHWADDTYALSAGLVGELSRTDRQGLVLCRGRLFVRHPRW